MAPLEPFNDANSVLGQVRNKFLLGVYNETYETLFNGGQQCYEESQLGFKIVLIAILLPFHLYYFYYGMKTLVAVADARRLQLQLHKRNLNPTMIEVLQGLLCFGMIAFQLHFKYHSNTIIFILNPCHIITLIFGLVSVLPFNRFSNLLMMFGLSSTFGAWLGIVFAENDELSVLELVMYYVQHVFAALMAPMVLFCAGRYKAGDYIVYPLPIFGFVLFSIYMRYFLTPISAMTWANLNHTLCGIDNHQIKFTLTFGMHKYFFFWADGYLQLASVTISFLNYYIAKFLCNSANSGNSQKTRLD